MTVKTHTFRLGRYAIDEADGLYGCCDVPGCDDNLGMIIMSGDTRRALNTSVHEMMHAEGVPDEWTHDGTPDRIASALWRLGWRRTNAEVSGR